MKYLGRAQIAYDGTTLDTAPGAKLNVGGIARKEVEGAYTIGHTEALKAATVECAVNVSKETPLEAIRSIAGATVTFRADTGQTFVVKNAFLTEPPEMTADDKGGDMKLVFKGDPAELV